MPRNSTAAPGFSPRTDSEKTSAKRTPSSSGSRSASARFAYSLKTLDGGAVPDAFANGGVSKARPPTMSEATDSVSTLMPSALRETSIPLACQKREPVLTKPS